MKKFDGVLICSDIDGTLLNSKGVVTPNVINSINYFQNNGGRFTLATGRSMDNVLPLLVEQLSIKIPIICLSGAAIYSGSILNVGV